MGFWEDNPDLAAGGGAYLTGDEKTVLIENEVAFDVLGITTDERTFGDERVQRFVLQVVIPEGVKNVTAGERLLAFAQGSVESRDIALARMAKYLEDPANTITSTIAKVGRSQVLKPVASE